MSLSSSLNNISVGKKLSASFALLVIMAAVIAGSAINIFSEYNQRSMIVAGAGSAESALLEMRIEERNFQLTRNERHRQAAEDLLNDAIDTLQELRKLFIVPNDHARVDFIADEGKAYSAQLSELARNLDANQATIDAITDKLKQSGIAMVDKAVELQQIQENRMKEQYSTAITTLVTITLVALLVAVMIAWFMIRSITAPIREAVEVANRVADGDLTVRVESQRGDEFGALLSAFSTMVTKLRDLIHQIGSDSSGIASASEELSTVTDQTRRGVSEQRDQTDQVATAMNEMVATVNEVAKSAESAFEAAQMASQTSGEGEAAVSQTLTFVTDLNTNLQEVMSQMHGLQGDIQNIGSVLDVIKSVAEQTNLLALNAAIEAARAGEQGRGFAVVADEVRSLAQRTQSSALEIETLITTLVNSSESSVKTMEAGTELAGQTLQRAENAGVTIREMAQAVSDIREYNSQIATAAEQQSSVAEDINQNVTLIRDVGEQSAASTEQVSSASVELARMAEGLSARVSQFKL
ncbi:methyl-accepting chemotaxis protein [Marinobacter fuscus]|uniref:Methyl-accepting chemotaxis protein n=1 Tax=Marinobacter fuscus TaxID=2109942 RepID=A0A2T1KTE9_9GAMM|nr:methyl-accepting chemotaxis protein [Marinobacter fuscus]PSF13371.1 methyl-accepting chemotaxis protein [Marinobacter fuscus]